MTVIRAFLSAGSEIKAFGGAFAVSFARLDLSSLARRGAFGQTRTLFSMHRSVRCIEALQRGIAKRQADTKDEDRTNYSLFRSNQIRLPTLKPKFLEAFKLKKHFCIRGEDLIGF